MRTGSHAIVFLALAAACDRDLPDANLAPPAPATATATATDTATDTATATATVAPRTLTLAAAGDIIFHRRVVNTARNKASDGGFDWILSGLRAALGDDADADSTIAVANLETPLTIEYRDPETGTPPLLGCPSEAAPALVRTGLDAVFLANNHAWDQTSAGLRDTIATCRGAGLVTVGAGEDEDTAYAFRVIERRGVKVAFVGFTHHVNGSPGQSPPLARVAKLRIPERVQPAIRAARAAADVVVVGAHWSQDFAEGATLAQRAIARQWVEYGADVIIGSGPHVLHEVERLPSPRGDAIVAYSLGNLLSNQGLRHRVGRRVNPALPPVFDPRSRDGVLLRVDLDLATPGRIRITSVAAVATWTENNRLAMDEGVEQTDAVRIVRLEDTDEATRTERYAAIRAALGPAVARVH